MSVTLAIDPGSALSAFTFIETATCRPLLHGKVPNAQLLSIIDGTAGPLWQEPTAHVAIEMVASYGMAVGAEVFETCVWTGRFQQAVVDWRGVPVDLVKRLEVKTHHCHDSKAKDSNITQALVDRFALGQPNRGKGTNKEPGWFHGFAADVWQAYALAVLVADTDTALNAR